MSRDQSIQTLFNALSVCDNNVSKLDNTYYIKHPTEDLIIVTYNKITNKSNMINCCRGLVLSASDPTNVISRGFDRFFPKFGNPKEILSIKRATIKEDGSLMFLFKFNNKWHLSTMHDFADNKFQSSGFTYENLFLQIINQPLNSFAENLINQFDEKDNILTFCFEMCSVYNRVIRKYDVPTLYLISAFGGNDGSNEYSINSNIQLPANVNHISEMVVPYKATYLEILEIVKRISQNDISFEGLVLEVDNGDIVERVKVKNPYYLIQHRLKYRSWITCTPDIIIPLILSNKINDVLHNLFEAISTDHIAQHNITKRVEYYENKISKIYSTVKVVVTQLISMNISSKKEYRETAENLFPNIYNDWKSLLFAVYNSPENVLEDDCSLLKMLFVTYAKSSAISLQTDPFIDQSHANHCCKLTTSSVPKNLEDFENDGLSYDNAHCYCGSKMNIVRLKTDLVRYKTCHCGKQYGHLIYHSGTLLGVCSDPSCLCTHEVNQQTKKLLGIPSCMFCKSLRLHIHEIIKSSKLSRQECYKRISDIMETTPDNTHMALFGINACIKILINFHNA